jgi:hypothetical protein
MHFSFRKSELRPSRFLKSLSHKIMKVIQEWSFGLDSMCGFQLTPEENMHKNIQVLYTSISARSHNHYYKLVRETAV